MNVKTQFSIKDLENLSGVKAHTIRIWEKRYSLLEPDRTDTNIRLYDLQSLKHLLNVSYLYNDGFKISKIAELSKSEIETLIEQKSTTNAHAHAINAFKTAMFDFDEILFLKTYNTLTATLSFREIFFDVFIPLLMEIGTLWQTSTIEPSHESFISELIKKKIIVNSESLITSHKKTEKRIFVLFLPYKEIHEIGLLYANYELLSSGFKTIYLGANIPLSSLYNVRHMNEKIIFLSYVTMQPEGKDIYQYIDSYQENTSKGQPHPLWLLGNKVQQLDNKKIPFNIKILQEGLSGLKIALETLKKT